MSGRKLEGKRRAGHGWRPGLALHTDKVESERRGRFERIGRFSCTAPAHTRTLAGMFMAAVLSAWGAPHVAAQSGIQAWTQAQTSPGLYALGRNVEVVHSAAKNVPRGARITRVQADRQYAGNADIQSFLCWNGTAQCVEFTGASVNSAAFSGLAADQPMLMVHRPRAWRGSPKPVFIRSNVTVWYELPG